MARRFFDKPIVSRAGKYFDTEGGVYTPDAKGGNPNIGYVQRTVKGVSFDPMHPDQIGKVYRFKAELEYGDAYIDGKLVENTVVGWRALEPPKLVRTVSYESGGGRLNNGFDSLMTALRMNGADANEITRLRDKWLTLSDDAKADIWNAYRKWQEDNGYGSYPNPYATDVTEVEEYLSEIGRLIDSA